jgi:2,4-dienoyl-CoA reductase-like NADH-dependent reductase (Old Yellow Enzyme family)
MEITTAFQSPQNLGTKIAPNRFLSQPIEHNQANKSGGFSSPMIEFYSEMSRGQWGVIIMETTAVSMQERCRVNGLVLDPSMENDNSWSDFFRQNKKINDQSLWIVEISAAGYKNQTGKTMSLFENQHELPTGEIMTTEYVEELLDDYIQATRLAYERGADGIDLKLCHGYFAGLFLRPNNQRKDQYGGTWENRTRFIKEYFRRAQKAVGDKNFIWTSRLNAWDGPIPGGFGMKGPQAETHGQAWIRDISEVEKLYSLLNDLGINLINISAGISVPVGMKDPNHFIHPYFIAKQEMALHAKKFLHTLNSNIAIASTGWSSLGPHSLQIGAEYLQNGIDFIGYGRQQLCEPEFPRKILQHSSQSSASVVEYVEEELNICIVCGKCYAGLNGEGPVQCPIYSIKS